jgi:hypothetical protein
MVKVRTPEHVQCKRCGAQGAGRIAHCEFVNPQWGRLLNLLEMNVDYIECRGERCGPPMAASTPGRR